MADKQAAQGTILKLDHDDNAAFDTMTLVTEINHPGREREQIEGKDLGDTFDVPIDGIENASDFSFTQFWDETDTEHTKIDDLFDSKAVASWQVVTAHAVPITSDFDGTVKAIGPTSIAVGGTLQRTVTCKRTTAITYT